MTDSRQTDHATEKCVEMSGIACAARAILRNKKKTVFHVYAEVGACDNTVRSLGS